MRKELQDEISKLEDEAKKTEERIKELKKKAQLEKIEANKLTKDRINALKQKLEKTKTDESTRQQNVENAIKKQAEQDEKERLQEIALTKAVTNAVEMANEKTDNAEKKLKKFLSAIQRRKNDMPFDFQETFLGSLEIQKKKYQIKADATHVSNNQIVKDLTLKRNKAKQNLEKAKVKLAREVQKNLDQGDALALQKQVVGILANAKRSAQTGLVVKTSPPSNTMTTSKTTTTAAILGANVNKAVTDEASRSTQVSPLLIILVLLSVVAAVVLGRYFFQSGTQPTDTDDDDAPFTPKARYHTLSSKRIGSS